MLTLDLKDKNALKAVFRKLWFEVSNQVHHDCKLDTDKPKDTNNTYTSPIPYFFNSQFSGSPGAKMILGQKYDAFLAICT